MEILIAPHPILKTRCDEVTDFSGMQQFTDELITTAQNAGLVGLASSQIGFLHKIFVMNLDLTGENPNWKTFINPVIKVNKLSGEIFAWESCGSIPNVAALVKRHKEINITAKDVNEKEFTFTLKSILARIALHEQDHLMGILITNKARQIRKY